MHGFFIEDSVGGRKVFGVWKAKTIGEKNIYEKVATVVTEVRRLGKWYRYTSSKNHASLRWGSFNQEGASLSTEPWLWEGYGDMHLVKRRGKGFKMFQSWDTSQISIMDGQPTPPQRTPHKKVYIRPYSGKPMVRDHYTTHFMGNQTVQMYGSFEGFPPVNSALLGLVIQWPLMVPPSKTNMTIRNVHHLSGCISYGTTWRFSSQSCSFSGGVTGVTKIRKTEEFLLAHPTEDPVRGKNWWWFQRFFLLGNDPIWWAYCSNGLKPPTWLSFEE